MTIGSVSRNHNVRGEKMNFKLDENDDFDEKETPPSNEDDHSENEEYVPCGFDEKDEAEDANRREDVSEEPKEDYDEQEDNVDETTKDVSALILKQRISVPRFSQKEEDNLAYAEAVMAYYEKENYEVAIEKFDEAIKKEKKGKRVKQLVENEIVAKSLYWQAESYVKTQDIAKAIKTFEYLVKTCKEHYLALSAKRRAEMLKAKHS